MAAQGNELIRICRSVAAKAEAGDYDNGGCAFCNYPSTAETFPFCDFCAGHPTQVEGVSVPLIKFYNAIAVSPLHTQEDVPSKRNCPQTPAWDAWDRFAVSIGEEPGTYGTRTMEEYTTEFPSQWAAYQKEIENV